jgi:hypothetical protein
MLVNFLEAPLLAVIIGYFTKYTKDLSSTGSYIFQQNENLPAYLFMAVVVALFMGLMVSAKEIIGDRQILERESFLNLSRLSYLNSKILIIFTISAIQTFSFVLVGNSILEIKGMTLSYWLILFSTSCMANMLGLNISAGLNSVITIYILIPFILVPQLLFSGIIVKFDSLHKTFRHPVYVPVIGDMMTSRWAYEALAVNQFKNNKYEKMFFAFDKEISNAGYQASLLTAQLKVRIEESKRNILLGRNEEQTKRNLKLLNNEIRSSQQYYGWPPFNQIDKLTMNSFDTTIARSTLKYLSDIKSHSLKISQEAHKQREEKYENYINMKGGKDAIIKLKTDYVNDKLSESLLNRFGLPKILELDHHLIRKMEPIYMEPTSKYGRAHFYAPSKKIGNIIFDTLWFNIMEIWFVSLFLYVTLVFDVLRRIINRFENIRLRKKS